MIGVVFHGRLGNRLFQYAAARTLAEDLETTLVCIEKSGSRNLKRVLCSSTPQPLPDLNLKHNALATRSLNLTKNASPKSQQLLIRKLFTHTFSPKRAIISRGLSTEVFDEKFFLICDKTLLSGFFQSQAYFKHRSREVKEWFAESKSVKAKIDDLLKRSPVEVIDAVAIHIRLGDYKEHYLKIDGRAHPYNLQRDYYEASIRFQGIERPLVLFSDSPNEAAKLLPKPPSWIFPDQPALDTLHAMSRFKRIVISNSSFSWWAGWLGDSEKIVCAPKFHIGRRPRIWYPDGIKVDGWKYF